MEENIKPLEKKVQRTVEENKKLEDLKSKFIEIRSKRMEDVLLHSRARWISEGEKVSKYFCSLEKIHASKHMNKLITNQGEEVCDEKEINTEVGKFYQKLYEKTIVEVCETEETVHTIPTLSDEEANNIEGKLTLEEATRALKNMKNNNSPGTDGFTSEFFLKCFGNRLDTLL